MFESAEFNNLNPAVLCEDEDFDIVEDEEPPQNFSLVSIVSTFIYEACPKFGICIFLSVIFTSLMVHVIVLYKFEHLPTTLMNLN